ncbi:MAG: nucleoside triphosphate pyrophosphohydrolase [Candidatus Moranbacteria bacterium]|nr:nucleoside triphosphate pyrophosphohydrolase [Candidatus Moranbacteria bacterium]
MNFNHFETSLGKENEYPKLVRDKIPEIIKKEKNVKVKIRILEDDKEYLEFLFKKIKEEVDELVNAKNKDHMVEELSDVMEVIDEILKSNNLNLKDIQNAQKSKVLERGGFLKRILMLEKK